jgi:hypothetical protein
MPALVTELCEGPSCTLCPRDVLLHSLLITMWRDEEEMSAHFLYFEKIEVVFEMTLLCVS